MPKLAIVKKFEYCLSMSNVKLKNLMLTLNQKMQKILMQEG